MNTPNAPTTPTINYTTLAHLNTILQSLQQDAATVCFTLAGLMIVVYSIKILLDQDSSPTAHMKRWEGLRTVILVAAIVAGAGAIILFARQLGGSL